MRGGGGGGGCMCVAHITYIDVLTFFFADKKDNIKLTTVAIQSELVYVKNEITVTIFCSTVYLLQHNSCCSSIYISSCVIVGILSVNVYHCLHRLDGFLSSSFHLISYPFPSSLIPSLFLLFSYLSFSLFPFYSFFSHLL